MSGPVTPNPMDGPLVVAIVMVAIIAVTLVVLAREIARQRRIDRALSEMMRIRMRTGADRMRQAARRSISDSGEDA